MKDCSNCNHAQGYLCSDRELLVKCGINGILIEVGDCPEFKPIQYASLADIKAPDKQVVKAW